MAKSPSQNNLTMGRGRIYIAKHQPCVSRPRGFRYVGYTDGFSISVETDSTDYNGKEGGTDEVAQSVTTSITRTATINLNDINPENLALFLLGKVENNTVDEMEDEKDEVEDINLGESIQIGESSDNPVGVRSLTEVSVAKDGDGGSDLEEGTDYEVDLETGVLTLLKDAENIEDGDDIEITYSTEGYSQSIVVSGNQTATVTLRYIADNPAGPDRHILATMVRLTPDGEYDLKSDDWQELGLSAAILKPRGAEALYIDGQPVVEC